MGAKKGLKEGVHKAAAVTQETNGGSAEASQLWKQ